MPRSYDGPRPASTRRVARSSAGRRRVMALGPSALLASLEHLVEQRQVVDPVEVDRVQQPEVLRVLRPFGSDEAIGSRVKSGSPRPLHGLGRELMPVTPRCRR